MYLIHQYSRDIAVPSGSILMSTGCYLVQTDDGRNILIDSGMPADADGSDPPTEKSAGILAQLKDPKGLFNTRLDSKTVRAIDFHEGDAINASALKALIVQGARLNRSLDRLGKPR